MRTTRFVQAALVALALAGPAPAQTTYTWNDTTPDWTATSAWTPSGPNWALPSRLTDSVAAFGSQAAIANPPTTGGNTLFANKVTLDNSGGASWSIAGTPNGVLNIGAGGLTVTGGASAVTANIAVTTNQTWDTGAGTLTVGGTITGLLGLGTITKAGSGTLVLDSNVNTFTGSIVVNAGTLQAGSAANNSSSAALRNVNVTLTAGTFLTTAGTNTDLRVGSLAGSGAVVNVNAAAGSTIHMLVLADSTYSGELNTGATGGINLRGTANQTFNGNTTGVGGTIGINAGATMTLVGTGDAKSGVVGATTIALRGGSFVLDNTGGNTGAATGRLPDAAAVTFVNGGSTLRLIGNATDGTTENVGALTLNAGAHTIRVDQTGGAAGTVLGFNGGATNFSLRPSTQMTVNFVGTGGTLGAAGANPRIVFTGTGQPFTGTGGLLANSAGGGTIGWATVNGTEWAGLGTPAQGIVALAPTLTTGTAAGLQAATATDLVEFNPATNQTLTGNVTAATFKVAPAGATSLDIGANSITSLAFMLAGASDFTITGTTGNIFGTASNGTRYVHVVDPNAVLSVNVSLAGANQPFTKSGAGTLYLSGASNQVAFAANTNINVVQGTLRGTLAALGGGDSTGGANTTLNLFGGVLEISGGGTFSRAINLAGTGSGGGLRFDNGGTARGDGGFSAFNGDASVTLVTTVGGSTPATLQWNTGGFVSNGYALLFGSTKSDSRVTLTNDVQLDAGTPGTYFAREVRVIDNPNSSGDYATLSGVVSGSVSADLLKTGAGILELTGQNTYQGNTLITAGALLADNTSGSATGTGRVVVTGGTLGGTGRIAGPVAVTGATLRGGNASGVGTLTIGGGLTLGTGARTIYRISDGSTPSGTPGGSTRGAIPNPTSNNFVDIAAGGLTAATADIATMQFVIDGTGTSFTQNQPYSYTVGRSFLAPGVPQDLSSVQLSGLLVQGLFSTVGLTANNFSLTGDSNGFLYVGFTPVPEPATVLAVAAGALGLGGFFRRIRRGPNRARELAPPVSA